MTVGSLFAGIGGFDLGFDRAGLTVRWQCEADKHARAVLDRRWPDVPCHPDIRELHDAGPVDLVCGGFPCQDLSTSDYSGRKGLGGERSGLWFEMLRVIREVRPAWVVAENVPGLLSCNGGRDFGTVLTGLAELGYGVAYRVLNSQFFGVAQRRRRVFIVGHLGDGRAAEILLESQGMSGGSPQGTGGGEDDTGHPEGCVRERRTAIGWVENSRNEISVRESTSYCLTGAPAYCLTTAPDPVGLASKAVVRRLTPRECARIQGFPDDWNDCQSDTQRYKQLGNAVTVNVAEWIGRRIVADSNGFSEGASSHGWAGLLDDH